MAWWKGDDRSHTNAKLLAAGLDGTGLYFRMVSWSASNETDGKVPSHVIPMLAPGIPPKQIAKLLEKLTKKVGKSSPLLKKNRESFEINDYLEYNPSAAQIREIRAKKQAAGTIGGKRSGVARGSKGEADAS